MSRRRRSRWHGLLPVYKQPGPTSHDVVELCRKALGERRIGHTGTLDPSAEGLLLLCVGHATRLQQYLLGWDKVYHGEVRLGIATTTYDAEGEPVGSRVAPPELDEAALRGLMARFSGIIDQAPPPYSAKKVAGRKLYELARSGEEVPVEPKRVTVHELELELREPDLLAVAVRASSGFYVRSLAHDIGAMLGCGGHLCHLRRDAVGPYHIDTALAQERLESAESPRDVLEHEAWIPIEKVQLPFPSISLNPSAAERFRHGQEVIVLRGSGEPLAVDSNVLIRTQAGQVLGIGRIAHVLARGRTVTIRPAMVLDSSVLHAG
jgi:tRNA pseudouridine55 synthase